MQNPKSDIWVPDTRPESVSTFTESYTPSGGQEQTATYKAIPNHTIIGGILNKLSFGWGHAKATWYNKLAGKTVKDKFDDMDTVIGAQSANMLGILTPRLIRLPGIVSGRDIVLTVNDSTIISSTGINENPNGLQQSLNIGNVDYYILAKADNSNPLNMNPISSFGLPILCANYNGSTGTSQLVAINLLSIYYDGTNTYALCTNKGNFESPITAFYYLNYQPFLRNNQPTN